MTKTTAVDITAIIDAARNRAGGWVEEYRAQAANRAAAGKVADALSASEYLNITGAKSISEQTVRNYRTAWGLASAFPEVAAHVGAGGQIHELIGYALNSPDVKQANVETWIRATVNTVNASDTKEDTLRTALKDYRALCKSARDAAKSAPIEDIDIESDIEDESDIVEIHPQELADAALLAMMTAAREYVSAIASGAQKNEANLLELGRILSALKAAKVAA
jgi:hypothetical protein